MLVSENSDECPHNFLIGVLIGIWLLMVLGDSVQYNQIHVNEFEGNCGVKSGSVTLPFNVVKKDLSCLLEVSVMMECHFEFGRVLLNRFQAGSKRELISLSHDGLHFSLWYLVLQDLLSIEKVCKSLRVAVKDDPHLWKTIHVDDPSWFKLAPPYTIVE